MHEAELRVRSEGKRADLAIQRARNVARHERLAAEHKIRSRMHEIAAKLEAEQWPYAKGENTSSLWGRLRGHVLTKVRTNVWVRNASVSCDLYLDLKCRLFVGHHEDGDYVIRATRLRELPNEWLDDISEALT